MQYSQLLAEDFRRKLGAEGQELLDSVLGGARRMQQLVDDASPYGAAGKHFIHDVIDPKDTRDYIIEALEISYNARNKGISEHKLANWPTKF